MVSLVEDGKSLFTYSIMNLSASVFRDHFPDRKWVACILQSLNLSTQAYGVLSISCACFSFEKVNFNKNLTSPVVICQFKKKDLTLGS